MMLIRSLTITMALLSGLLAGCTSVFYQPDRTDYAPQLIEQYRYRSGHFVSNDGTKLAYLYFHATKLANGSSKPLGVVLQFHGNGQNMTAHYRSLIWLLDDGYDLMVFDYRGYGTSGGRPSATGLYEDGIAAVQTAGQLAASADIPLILYGQSLGGSLLLKVLAANPGIVEARAVVIESAFYSYRRIAREKMAAGWLTWPFQWLACLIISDKYSPGGSGLDGLSPTPVVLIYPGSDRIVPPHHGQLLYAEMAKPKHLWITESGNHLSAMWTERKKYRRRLLELLETQYVSSTQ